MNNNENNNSEELNTISLGSIPDNANNVNVPLSAIPPVKPVEPVASVDTLSAPPQDTIPNVPTPEEPIAPAATVAEISQDAKNPVTEIIKEEPTVTEDVKISSDIDPFSNVDIPPVFDDIGTVPPAAVDLVVPIAPVAPVEPVNYDVPDTINNIATEPIFNDIGTIPPIPDAPILTETPNDKKGKKPINKTIFVLIIVLVIAAVGVAVYVLLGMAKTKVGGASNSAIKTKNVEIELGGEISTVITDYAIFNGINSSNCSLNTTKIGNELNEEYPFTITCNGIDYEGKAKIVDTTSPEVILKEVTTSINSEIKPEDFIEACTDATECSYEFKDEAAVKELLKTVGIYKNQVLIIAKDTSGNTTEVKASLIVGEENTSTASVHLVCTKNNDSYKEVQKLGLDNGNVVGSIIRDYTFSFANEEEYKKAKGENADGSEMTYQDISGKVTFDDAKFQFTITKTLTFEELKQEVGTDISTSFLDISTYFGSKGYSCELK